MQDRKIRVVLADDHPFVRAGIRQFLERAPDVQIVGEASDGDEALRLIAQHNPDVVVLDLQMPRVSGVEVLRRLQAERPGTRVLVLTAYDDDPYVFAALRAGAKGYILKTAAPDELAHAVRVVYEGHSALDPSVTGRLVRQIGSPGPVENPADRLTGRELEVLKLAAHGLTNQAIGSQLGISERTVHSHLVNIFSKLGVSTRTEAAMKAVRLGWLSLEDTSD